MFAAGAGNHQGRGLGFRVYTALAVNALIPSNVEEIATNFFRAFNKQFIAAFYQDYQRVKTNRELVNINE